MTRDEARNRPWKNAADQSVGIFLLCEEARQQAARQLFFTRKGCGCMDCDAEWNALGADGQAEYERDVIAVQREYAKKMGLENEPPRFFTSYDGTGAALSLSDGGSA